MTKSEKQARTIIARLTIEELINQWELTTNCEDENIYRVRGWLMDEIEKRSPEGFNSWLESEYPADEELRTYVL